MKTMGINHIALVARDMVETVKFYTEVLQMPLVKTVELPTGGQTKHEGLFVRSVYFTDQNGIMMEFAANTKVFGPEDVRHAPASATA